MKTWVSGLHSSQICFYDVSGLAKVLKIIGAAMGRPLRIEYPDAFYHITARGNERQSIWDAYLTL